MNTKLFGILSLLLLINPMIFSISENLESHRMTLDNLHGKVYFLRGHFSGCPENMTKADEGGLYMNNSSPEDFPYYPNDFTSCGLFIQFPFYEPINTYDKKYTINSIYFRCWMRLDSTGQGYKFGYTNTTEHGAPAKEHIMVSHKNPVSNLTIDGKNYVLVYGILWATSESRVFTKASIRNLTINVDGDYPKIVTDNHNCSYIIFNLRHNRTLAAIDSDEDGLSDYIELYEYITNPYDSDTDDDGIPDNWEIALGQDPNNYKR